VINTAQAIDEFQTAYNNMESDIKITLDSTLSKPSVVYLDLEITLNHDLKRIELKTYFKTTNKFQYLNFNSFHPIGTIKGLIITELRRYLTHSSNENNYNETKEFFKQRLLLRNYPKEIIDEIFTQLPFDTNLRKQILTNQPRVKPKIAATLLKKSKDAQLHNAMKSNRLSTLKSSLAEIYSKRGATHTHSPQDESPHNETNTSPIVLTIPYHPLTAFLNFKKILTSNSFYDLLPKEIKDHLIVGYSTAPNIKTHLVSARLHRNANNNPLQYHEQEQESESISL
jgi:hypothetical protein